MDALRKLLQETPGFTMVEEENITSAIVEALALDDARKREMINALVPSKIRPLFNEFAGVRGGEVFENLRNGKLVYHRFLGVKRKA